MGILKVGKLEISDSQKQKLISSLNRVGPRSVTLPAQKIFLKTEHYFRQPTLKADLQKIDFVGITQLATSDGDILANYHLIVADAGCKPDSDVKKGILHDIVSLYVRVHSFSYAKDIVQRYKIKAKQIQGKSLRKEINRSCQGNDQRKKWDSNNWYNYINIDIYYPSNIHHSYHLTENRTVQLINIVPSFSSVESNAKVSKDHNIVSCSGTKMLF